MASAAPSDGGRGDDKPPESAPVNLTSLEPPADPQRNGESPAPPSAPVPPSGDVDMSAMGMTEIPDPTRAQRGTKRPLSSRSALCRACARRRMILRGTDPGPQSADELSAPPPSGTRMEIPDAGALGTKGSPSATARCGPCEFRKRIHLNRLLRRNSGVPAPPPGSIMPIPPLDDKSPLELEQKRRARRGKKRPLSVEPLSVEQERGYRECDVGKKLMRHKWDGLCHKWAGLHPDWALEIPMPGVGTLAGGRDLLEKMMLDRDSALEVPAFGAAVGGRDLLEKMMLLRNSVPEVPGIGAVAGYRDLLEKMMLPWDSALEVTGFRAVAGGRHPLEKMMLHQDSALEVTSFRAAAGGRHPLEKMMLPWDPLKVTGFRATAGGRHPLEKMMLHQDSALEVTGFRAAAGGRHPLEQMMLHQDSALEVPGSRCSLLEEMMLHRDPVLDEQKALRVDVLQEKLAQMTKVLTKVLHEGRILQVSTKLMRLLCPEVGSSAAAGDGLDGSDWSLAEEAIENLVNQTGEGMQDIAKTVIPKVFSKEILYDLIMACVGRYPKLLDDKGKLTKEKHEQYQKQLDLMVNLTTVYENDPENFSKIMKLMCKIGRCGPLPSEVIDDISPGLDPTTMEQLYTGMLELLRNVDKASPVHINPSSK